MAYTLDSPIKFLTEGLRGPYSGHQYEVPSTVRILDFQELKLCVSGLHYTWVRNALMWFNPVAVDVVDLTPQHTRRDPGKACTRVIEVPRIIPTWNARTQRLFAADVAERINEGKHEIVAEMVGVARQRARDEISQAEMIGYWRSLPDLIRIAFQHTNILSFDPIVAADSMARQVQGRPWASELFLSYLNGERG